MSTGRTFNDVVVELTSDDEADAAGPARSLEMTIKAVKHRHEEWDKEFETIEKKEGELLAFQWKLIREQMGTLARDLAVLQHDLHDLKFNSKQALMKVNQGFRMNEAELIKEKDLRHASNTIIEKELQQLKENQASESKQRDAEDSKLRTTMMSKFEQLGELIESRYREQVAMEQGVGSLRGAVDAFQPQLEAMHDAIKHDARERQARDDQIMGSLSSQREMLAKELQDRESGHQASIQSLRKVIEGEKGDRDSALAPLRAELEDLRKQIAPHTEELPALRSKCVELEDTLAPRLRDHQKAIERVAGERAAGQARLEQSVTDIFARIESEAAARTLLTEEVEQLTISRNKTRSLLNEQAESAKQARDVLAANLREEMGKEISAREAKQEDIVEHISAQRMSADSRIDNLHRDLQGLDERLRLGVQQEREAGANVGRKADILAKQIYDLHEAVARCFSEERATREANMLALEEQISLLDRLFQDVGKRFTGNTLRRRSLMSSSLTSASFESIIMSTQPLEPSLPYTATSVEDAAAEHTSYTPPAQATPGPPEVSPPEAASRDLAPPDAAPGDGSATGAGEPVVFALSEGDAARLGHLLQHNRVQLVVSSEAGEARVQLATSLQFKPVHHGDSPVAHFLNEEEAMTLLGDVGELLSIYSTAALLIEGHTATPPAKMDKWAHDLARGRAELVKNTIASFGVDPERLTTISLPGNLGTNTHDVALKVTKFGTS
mmetsp:Transcript_12895/g.36529  ORF Transcript_12895/g.36529 Transcript_12895/m.36529 type:complete len:729 (+) Transcript_12895:175-2361(+)